MATDPAGTVTCQQFDDAGRRTGLVENYEALSSSSLSGSSGSSFGGGAPGSPSPLVGEGGGGGAIVEVTLPQPGIQYTLMPTTSTSFEGIFARQVQAIGKPGDLLLGISTSGGSKNVVRAAGTAKGRGLKVVVLTGSDRKPLLQLADVAICIPSDSTQYIQEAHLVVEHILCHLVERALFNAGEPCRSQSRLHPDESQPNDTGL
ncbi:MAG: SIS domain-containing protein [Deltaproteobacteria bacterium]